MKKTITNRISGVFLFVAAFLTTSSFVGAQETEKAKEKFDRLAPLMTAADSTNADDVQKMESAQQDWMKFCLDEAGRPGSEALKNEVNALMANALSEDYPVETKVWLLHLLAWSASDAEVEAIAACLQADDVRVAGEAARALALIPGSVSEKALKSALENANENGRRTIQDALNARTLDLSIPMETDSPMNLAYADDQTVADWVAGFDSLSDDQKARTLASLTVRKDKRYAPLAAKSLGSDVGEVKRAAALALEKIGSVADLPVLLDFAYNVDRGLGIRILSNLVADGLDDAILKSLQNEQNPDRLAVLAEITSGRRMKSAVGEILKLAQKDDFPNRLALLNAAERLADSSDIPDFVDALIKIPAGGDRDRAEQIIARLCNGDATLVLEKLTNRNAGVLLPAVGRIGGDKALEQIERGLKSSDSATVALSIRALCNWPDAVVAKRLLEIAQNEKIGEGSRIQALRAFARVISLPDDQIGIEISTAEKLETLKKAMKLATRNEERQLILDRSSAVRSVETVAFALEYIDDPELSANACRTVVELAHHDYLRKENKDAFRDALDKVLETSNDRDLKDRAQNYKNAIQ